MNSYTCRNTALNSLQKWDIGNRIRTVLLADDGIAAMVGQNIYPIVAPENTDGDFIVYRRESYSKSGVKMGVKQRDIRRRQIHSDTSDKNQITIKIH